MDAIDTAITRVEAWACRVPLQAPVVLGSVTVTERDFVIARVTTASGLCGAAFALTRGAPVDLIIGDLLGPLMLGCNAADIPARLEDMRRSMVMLGPHGVVGRGISILDICLWDIAGRRAGKPLWKLINGSERRVPVMLVAPYSADNESDKVYASRLVALANSGHRILKLYPLNDPVGMTRRLAAVRSELGNDVHVVVDMAWTWRRAVDAIPAVRTWKEFDLLWIEDPIPSSEAAELKTLKEAVEIPIAAGDEESVLAHVRDIIAQRAVNVLRLDSTTIGGLSSFMEVAKHASAAGLQVSPHVYPEIHHHTVLAFSGIAPVETYPLQSETWGAHRFLMNEGISPDADGLVDPPQAPGIGIEFDWEAVAALALRKVDLSHDD